MPKDIIIQQSLFLSHIHALYTVCITNEILPEIFWPIMIIVTCFIVNLFLNIQFSWGFKTDPTSRIWVIIMSKDLVKTCLFDTWSIYIQNNAFEIVSQRYESYVNTWKNQLTKFAPWCIDYVWRWIVYVKINWITLHYLANKLVIKSCIIFLRWRHPWILNILGQNWQ